MPVYNEKLAHYEKIGTLWKYVTHYKPETRNKEPETPNKNHVFTQSSEYSLRLCLGQNWHGGLHEEYE